MKFFRANCLRARPCLSTRVRHCALRCKAKLRLHNGACRCPNAELPCGRRKEKQGDADSCFAQAFSVFWGISSGDRVRQFEGAWSGSPILDVKPRHGGKVASGGNDRAVAQGQRHGGDPRVVLPDGPAAASEFGGYSAILECGLLGDGPELPGGERQLEPCQIAVSRLGLPSTR
jgi:hypothetical protein